MRAALFVLATMVCPAVAQPLPTTTKETSPADWLRDARIGALMHFLPEDAASFAAVNDFDVDALAAQLEQMGAKYFVFTLGQNSGFFNAPNATYDRVTNYKPGERCSTRDLPLALYTALKSKNIRLMLYLPCQPPNQDPRAQKAFGFKEGPADQVIDTERAKKWAEVIAEWSERYGDKVSGWWFDGAYPSIRFDEDIAGTYAEAARKGNPKSIVTFNPGVSLVRHTKVEDYTAGELNSAFETVPTSRWVEGAQWHALTYLGSWWGKLDTKHKTDQWVAWFEKVVAGGGAVTLDVGPNLDKKSGPIGAISRDQMQQFRAISASLLPRIVVRDAPPIRMPGSWPREPFRSRDWVKSMGPLTDCNSPVHRVGDKLYLFNSWEHPSRSEGPSLDRLGDATPVKVDTDETVKGGRWLEGVWSPPKGGKLYGWYHIELDNVQGRGELEKRYPCVCQIGAMVSEDDGLNWKDQGFVVTPPKASLRTSETTKNAYYVGGIGDFGTCPDQEGRFIYFFAVSFHSKTEFQGLTAYRLAVTDCDKPVGKVKGWRSGKWSEPGLEGECDPIIPTKTDWHGDNPAEFWGPVVHWNTHLKQYVMVLNRVKDPTWTPDGYYASFNRDIADPKGWSTPVKFMSGDDGMKADPKKPGRGWYATVIGSGPGETGNVMGRTARLFFEGRSRWEIEFETVVSDR